MSGIYDVVVIGAGPAGVTSAVYCARAGKKTAIIEKEIIGGKITETPEVKNIPGFVSISGMEFGQKLEEQLEENAVDVIYDTVTSIQKNDCIAIDTESGDRIFSHSCIIACGTKNRLLNICENEEQYIGKGLYFCATCDGPIFKDKDVIVVGGGNSAVTEAIELSKYCKNVTIVQNLKYLTAEEKLITKLKSINNINIRLNKNISRYIINNDKVCGLIVQDSDSDAESHILADGIFIAIGLVPQNDIFKDCLSLDNRGYIITNESHMTSIENVFACGDCVQKNLQQVTIACGDGASTAMNLLNYMK